ncbi:major facilitator superfamily domain-containing protein 6-like [Tachypleus tridentatus]|uniref:major facilitator superfamily domain-containing protein 6-like n=1 Tax=Tachypleus tridentatus TaxID=6853 RepID=UPI003FD04CCB
MKSFWQDLIRKELIPVKILMFLIYGGQATLYPYFTVHLKSLGMSIRETAIVFAVQPLVALFVAPLIGVLADRIGNFKILFCFFLTFSAASCLGLYFTPPVERSFHDVILELDCHSDPNIPNIVRLNTNNSCAPKNSSYMEEVTVKLSSCQYVCDERNRIVSDSELCFENDNIKQENCVSKNESIVFHIFNLNATSLRYNENNTVLISYTISNNFSYEGSFYQRIVCIPEYKEKTTSSCLTICEIEAQDNGSFCNGERNSMKTFWIYLSIRLCVSLGIGLVNGLFDAVSMAVTQKYNADVGYQRMWQALAMCSFAPLSGGLVDWISEDVNAKNYSPCFYLYAALYLTAAVVSLFVDLSMKIPSEGAFKNLWILLCTIEVDFMLFHVLFLGISWGFLENFLFWFLESELESSTLLMGLTLTVGAGTGVPMAIYSSWITEKIGHVNVLILAFAAYTVRFLGYSYATSPYLCLIYETMENFTVTLLTVGVTLYCTHLAPLEMLTTMMTLWNNLHFISGRAFGSLSGGFMTDAWGFRETFRVYSYVSAGLCVFYFLINILYLRKLPRLTIAADASPETKKELEEQNRALSIAGVVSHHGFHEMPTVTSLNIAGLYSSNMQSILALEGRRHSYQPRKRRSLENVGTREKPSISLSFVPSTEKTSVVPKSNNFLNSRNNHEKGPFVRPSRSRAGSNLAPLPENKEVNTNRTQAREMFEPETNTKSSFENDENIERKTISEGQVNIAFIPDTNILETTVL